MRNQPTLAFCTYLCFICLSLFSFSALVAQENGFHELKLSEESSQDRDAFYNLIYNLHPTAYIENSSIKIGGNSGYNELPISKLTFHDTKSFSLLNQPSTQFNNVQLMTITVLTVADLNNRIDLTEARGLNRLEYIFIECYFECTESQIKEFITHETDTNIRIFYKVSKPS